MYNGSKLVDKTVINVSFGGESVKLMLLAVGNKTCQFGACQFPKSYKKQRGNVLYACAYVLAAGLCSPLGSCLIAGETMAG